MHRRRRKEKERKKETKKENKRHAERKGGQERERDGTSVLSKNHTYICI